MLGNARRSRDVIDFPEQGVLFWDVVEPVEIIQTHVSLVLLAGDCAYKLKRAIKFPPRTFLPLSSGGRPARPSSRSTPEWRLNFISMSER